MRRRCFILALAAALTLPGVPARAETTPAPPAETTLGDVQTVTAGFGHSCALLTNTELRCWGDGSYGKLGQGAFQPSYTPVTVVGVVGPGPLTGVTQVSAGKDHTCALLTSHQVRCWGMNQSGQVGADTGNSSYNRPQVVRNTAGTGPLQGVIAIDVGGDTSCALLANHQLRCWGENFYGAVGDGTPTDRRRPTAVSNPAGTGPLTGVAEISVGGHHTCARLANSQVRCWGHNIAGQVGDGTRTNRRRPQVVKSGAGGGPLTGVSQISTGDLLACARLSTGRVRCWGRNKEGGLGDGSSSVRSTRPVTVRNLAGTGPLAGIARIEAGQVGACALTNGGEVRCWGQNDHGQLANDLPTDTRNPLPVVAKDPTGTGPLTGVTQLDRTARTACVRLTDGYLRCWGYGLSGNIGDGDDVDRPLPVAVSA